MDPINLFVYGTLKRGHHNHRLLSGAEFLGNDEAPGRMHARHDRYSVPVVKLPIGPEDWVKGEVYRVVDAEMLRRLDRLEGHPHGYTRTPVPLRSGRQAEIYYWLRETYNDPFVPSGEWPVAVA